ncbi:MAG TPA: VWA domain-containing protein [Pseudonocardiaceae bacterium]|nr:VWA domain-containing protein [Pseudonocardiaceae bacterium]
MAEDLAGMVAGFGAALRAAGLPVGPDRCARFAQAVTVVEPATTRELYWCALATLVSDPAQLPILDAVFGAVFRGLVDPAQQRGQEPGVASPSGGTPSVDSRSNGSAGPPREVDLPIASAGERLSTRDFAELTDAELARLSELMRELALRTPPRRSRRQRAAPAGHRVDLRASLRKARRTGGYPLRLERTTARTRPRRLVVLCDISGSMQPYARAMLQLLYCAAQGQKAETFTFATRLTRLTPALAGRPGEALAQAGHLAPDWSGGTRIALALRTFLRDHGRRGMARGAVTLIISDGWEGGDPAELGRAMAALSRLAFRIVWANPRTARPGYRPLTGGMAAAWPYCDAVVSAHRLDALPDLLAALADPIRRRPR